MIQYSGRARGSVLGCRSDGSSSDGRHTNTRRIIAFLERDGVTKWVKINLQVSDRLDCFQISGQYSMVQQFRGI
jgi:hypothetical protein